ncbi:MAG: cytidylate kinase-like family protein [Dehalococcoidia bacterium]|nr:cytidylate kinase-like family protein [Dehalococcoidia bacterium]
MPVVTMSGNIASGAREVGEAVARVLGVDFVDQQLMVQAAQRCGVPVGSVAEHDERYASFRQRVSAVLNAFLERSAVASGADPLTGATGLEGILSRTYAEMAAEHEEPQISDQLYLKTITAIIGELAATGDIVILGHGSQMMLAGLPRVLHVLCVAPQKLRAHRLAEREGIGLEEATRRTVESDRARAAFYRKFWKVEVENPNLYDLTIETSRLPYDLAAELVATAARARAANGPPAATEP